VTEQHDQGLSRLTALMRSHAEAPVDPALDQAGKLALERRLRAEAAPRSRPLRPLLLAAALLGAAGVVGFVELRPRAVSYEVRGTRSDGPYISAPATTPVTVAFSDGSSLEAGPGARLRVEEARVTGARVFVERGTTRVHVEHHASSAWNFLAGPFDVRVTGTRFELSWDPSTEAVDLHLLEGAVEVRGPFAEAPIAVRSGQRFRADLATRSMTVIDALAAEPARAAARPAANTAAANPGPAAPAALPPLPAASANEANDGAPAETAAHAEAEPKAATRSEPTAHASPTPLASESWPVLVARGQFETVVAKAGERGASECERACSASDLRALADAARYTGRASMAESALLSLRRRFGTSRESRSAAFLLGRVEEARGDTARAERWYDTYLREVPAGELAAEALAGKMRAVLAREGRTAAAPLATQYLARYPNGVHAESARGILGQASRP